MSRVFIVSDSKGSPALFKVNQKGSGTTSPLQGASPKSEGSPKAAAKESSGIVQDNAALFQQWSNLSSIRLRIALKKHKDLIENALRIPAIREKITDGDLKDLAFSDLQCSAGVVNSGILDTRPIIKEEVNQLYEMHKRLMRYDQYS